MNLERPRITKMIMHAQYLIYTTKHFQVKKEAEIQNSASFYKVEQNLTKQIFFSKKILKQYTNQCH